MKNEKFSTSGGRNIELRSFYKLKNLSAYEWGKVKKIATR
jgi:hypothetical protein